MSDTPVSYPAPDDTRYDLRVKLRLAMAHAKLGEAGVYEHALAAIAELAMGKKLTGEPIEKLHPRTQIQAARAFFKVAADVLPKRLEHTGADGSDLPAPQLNVAILPSEEAERLTAEAAQAFLESMKTKAADKAESGD